MPKATQVVKPNDLVTITHEGKEVQVDLMKRCPPELFKQLNVPWKSKQMYISATLVRDIIRSRWGIQVTKETVLPPMLWATNAILQAEAEVLVDGEVYCGTGFDVVWLKKLAVAAMGQGWHVASLALKSALKKRFAFFEGDFSTAEAEGNTVDVVDLDDIANELSQGTPAQTTAEVVPQDTTPTHEDPTTSEAPVEVAPPVPAVEPVVEVPVEETPPIQTETILTAVQAFEKLLHEMKAKGENTLNHIQIAGKQISEQYNIERGSPQHKELLDKAGELMKWFTS